MKWIDIPPVWLAGALVLAWWLSGAHPLGLSFGGLWADFLGGLCLAGGVLLMALGAAEMRKWRTTVMPHEEARHLVTTGIFARSRNPIYLGDVLILTGLILIWDAPLALVLIPIFV